eukprot:5301850-Amphidinium_carterae.1
MWTFSPAAVGTPLGVSNYCQAKTYYSNNHRLNETKLVMTTIEKEASLIVSNIDLKDTYHLDQKHPIPKTTWLQEPDTCTV